ncbi:winged helix-turn-helix transcriptional regulator [Methanoculleus sp. MH98A]|uniref:winged helix-turn-helix transcriptional regulator n=1 Tax=Methanoculleus sp. MH98A TaxID=1495314 RepID=UPI00049ECA70|nr:winged helix-turn-helix transcriptional regulator [Methanoculleus sp. MH98A]KDE54399.1 hypothetical protein EI28_02380 [Methanoculleus sp. MH98A]
MPNRTPAARSTLLFITLMLLIPTGSAASTIMSEGEFPELVPDDPAAIYIWNVPLKLVLLDFVFMIAPLLFLPVQILISVLAWLCLGYRRISRKNALEHDTRHAAYLCIRDNPGINHSTLSHMLGVNVGTLRYHLETLCETGQIVSEHDHGLLRYYANSRAASEGEKTGYTLNGTRKLILDLLGRNPGMTRKEVASALDIAGASVTWHTALLAREGTIRSEKDGRVVRYFPWRDAVSRTNRDVDATG